MGTLTITVVFQTGKHWMICWIFPRSRMEGKINYGSFVCDDFHENYLSHLSSGVSQDACLLKRSLGNLESWEKGDLFQNYPKFQKRCLENSSHRWKERVRGLIYIVTLFKRNQFFLKKTLSVTNSRVFNYGWGCSSSWLGENQRKLTWTSRVTPSHNAQEQRTHVVGLAIFHQNHISSKCHWFPTSRPDFKAPKAS